MKMVESCCEDVWILELWITLVWSCEVYHGQWISEYFAKHRHHGWWVVVMFKIRSKDKTKNTKTENKKFENFRPIKIGTSKSKTKTMSLSKAEALVIQNFFVKFHYEWNILWKCFNLTYEKKKSVTHELLDSKNLCLAQQYITLQIIIVQQKHFLRHVSLHKKFSLNYGT